MTRSHFALYTVILFIAVIMTASTAIANGTSEESPATATAGCCRASGE